MSEAKINPPLPPTVTSTIAAQGEAVTRPVIGGTGTGPRQKELNRELGKSDELDPVIKKANDDLAAGRIPLDKYHEITRTH